MSFPAYPGYKKSDVEWLGEVPKHWILTPLKHLALLNPRKSGYDGDTEQLCSFVPMEKLKTGVVQLDEERPIGEVIGGYTYFEDGDVLQAKVTPCFENKNIAIAKGLTNGIGFGSSEINVLRPYQGVNAEYLYYRVQEDNYMDFCTSSMIGAGGLKRVPTDVINNFKVATPEAFEQTQIARFLDHETARIDALIEEQQRLIELLKEKRQSVISQAVTKGLDPSVPMKDSGVEWLGEVPAHWIVRKGGYIGKLFGSEVVPEDMVNGSGNLPFLKVGSLSADTLSIRQWDFFIDPSIEKAYRPRSQFVVFPKRGAAIFLNKVNVVEVSALLDPNLMGWEMEAGNDAYYFANVLKCRGLAELADVSTVPQINNKHISPEKFPVPPSSEQHDIVAFLDTEVSRFDQLVTEAENGVSLLIERRSALISAAVTGKIDVRGWQPPASVQAPVLEAEAV
ncbi:restriction endonuclease subunit S [Pseudomonas caricapapayae]|uniref:restriction endonuclease subunit S n=1 Tax=Pseudomonas caricapapayae TaxID=46678 RepID=UPI000EFE0931|nr:restriction endonuclease subunit S [Pseudomonas caricapapayae]